MFYIAHLGLTPPSCCRNPYNSLAGAITVDIRLEGLTKEEYEDLKKLIGRKLDILETK